LYTIRANAARCRNTSLREQPRSTRAPHQWLYPGPGAHLAVPALVRHRLLCPARGGQSIFASARRRSEVSSAACGVGTDHPLPCLISDANLSPCGVRFWFLDSSSTAAAPTPRGVRCSRRSVCWRAHPTVRSPPSHRCPVASASFHSVVAPRRAPGPPQSPCGRELVPRSPFTRSMAATTSSQRHCGRGPARRLFLDIAAQIRASIATNSALPARSGVRDSHRLGAGPPARPVPHTPVALSLPAFIGLPHTLQQPPAVDHAGPASNPAYADRTPAILRSRWMRSWTSVAFAEHPPQPLCGPVLLPQTQSLSRTGFR